MLVRAIKLKTADEEAMQMLSFIDKVNSMTNMLAAQIPYAENEESLQILAEIAQHFYIDGDDGRFPNYIELIKKRANELHKQVYIVPDKYGIGSTKLDINDLQDVYVAVRYLSFYVVGVSNYIKGIKKIDDIDSLSYVYTSLVRLKEFRDKNARKILEAVKIRAKQLGIKIKLRALSEFLSCHTILNHNPC
jgi:hypothetical protein